ncbi:MAG: SLBB domain-containing protein, partial [Myxococcota bacterium]
PTELKQAIRRKLAKFIKLEGVEITVTVNTIASYYFTVSGEVNQPGIVNSQHYVTVAEAIARVGGLTRFAKKDQMVLMRRDIKTGQVRTVPLDYNLLTSGQRPEMNLVLMRGDSLHVP